MSRRLLTAALGLCALVPLLGAVPAHAAPGDLPRLTGSPPAGTERTWFDDHSVSGDDHLSWSPAAGALYTNDAGQSSQREPQGIRSVSTLHVGGLGSLEVCGYPSGTTGWMRAYQVAPGDMHGASCPASEPGTGRAGWFRYVFARHSATHEFDRWHLMDLERSALVPLPTAEGGPGGSTPTVWDNHWGSCVDLLGASLACQPSEAAGSLDVGVAAGTAKVTQDTTPDTQLIPIPVDLQPRLPNGRYQVVTLTNPYGLLREQGGAIGSVSCVTVDLQIGATGYGEVSVTVADAKPSTCRLPSVLDPALSGPTGFDPMAGAETVPSCDFTGSHCWTPDPLTPPHTGAFLAAHSLAGGDPVVVASTAVAQGSPIPAAVARTGLPADDTPGGSGTPADPGTPTTGTDTDTGTGTGTHDGDAGALDGLQLAGDSAAPGPPADDTPAPAPRSSSAATVATTRARSALRRVFGTGVRRATVTCRAGTAGAATCTVRWRTATTRYSGRILLRTTARHWQYRVDVTKRRGDRTTHVRRAYRTGGTLTA